MTMHISLSYCDAALTSAVERVWCPRMRSVISSVGRALFSIVIHVESRCFSIESLFNSRSVRERFSSAARENGTDVLLLRLNLVALASQLVTR